MISYLDWDSNFFGLKIGKIEMNISTINDMVEIEKLKIADEYDLVYLFIDKLDNSTIEWLEKKGVNLVDQKVIYQKNLVDHQIETMLRIEKYNGDVTPKLLELAIESGHKSRFMKDIRLTSRFIDLYRLWIEKSVNGELADELLVSYYNTEITGFVTLKKNKKIGTIGLIAVDKNFRGIGIGRGLLIAAENWFKSNNCNKMSVITQQENIEACRLYLRSGFKILKSQSIFHY
ncbi:MAG TPA: GNAT family N-acetyltransferase [Paludibacter sp.]